VSRAFVKDQDEDQGADDIPDRVVSPHRNLVTPTGLAQIDEELRRSRGGLAAARGSADRAEIARHRRDLRYWSERRSSAELVPALEQSVTKAKENLRAIGDAGLASSFRVMQGDTELMAMPVGAALRFIMLNHWYHHRGQLSVYLRELGVPVPSIYGPSADENPFAAAAGR